MPAATFSRFVEALCRTPALNAEQQEQFVELQQRCQDSRELAQELLRRGWLTAYQINHMIQGRANELVVGPFVLLERLGEGGMGQVFKARQTSMQRIVALKVIRPECLTNQRVIKRFQREIRAAGELTHPNIVRAYDADQVNGAYFIAMEYVEGIDLARLIKQSGPLPVWQACELIRQAALGLQHAFERGLVHRDIKPANLLLTVVKSQGPGSGVREIRPRERTGSRPSLPDLLTPDPRLTAGVLKITDFGLARWTEDDPDRPISHLTQLGSVLGTPEFISPEQARSSSTCDIRADLYSLGCTFYYLLAGQAPFPSGTLTDKLLAHQLDQAESVSKVRRTRLTVGLDGQEHAGTDQLPVPAAIEQVIAKLMAKRPEQRFQTPSELAAELASIQERLARGALPVPPRPQPETLMEIELTPRPTPARQAPAAIVAKSAARPAGARLRDAGVQPEAVVKGRQEARAIGASQPSRAFIAVSVPAQRRRLWPWLFLPALAMIPIVAVVAGLFGWAIWHANAGPDHSEADREVAADEVLWAKLQLKAQKKPAGVPIRQELLQFRTQYPTSRHVRDVDEWLARLPSPFDSLDRVMLPKVPLVTVKSPPEMVGVFGEHRGYLNKPASLVVVSPDGRWMIGSEEPTLRFWDTASLSQSPARLQPHGQRVFAAAFSPDGKRLATAGDDPMVRLWDPTSRNPLLVLAKHTAPVSRLAFRRDGSLLASAGADGKIWLWDPVSGTDTTSLPCGNEEVQSLAFSPDGQTLFWGAAGVLHWTPIIRTKTAKPGRLETPGAVQVLTFAPDGQTLLCGGGKGKLLVCAWDGRNLVEQAKLDHEVVINKNKQGLQVNQAAYSPDGLTFATASNDHRVRVWDAKTRTLQKEWDLHCPVLAAAFSPDGRHLITGNGNSTLTVFRLASLTAEK